MTLTFFLPLANKNFISSNKLYNLIKKKSVAKNNLKGEVFSDGGDDADFIFEKKFNYNKKKITIYNYQKKRVKCIYYTKGRNLFIHGKNILGGQTKKIKTLEYTSYGVGQIIKKNLNKKFFYISLGGSLNTDAGLGLLQSLGVRFEFKKKFKNRDILTGKDLAYVDKIFIDKKLKNKFKKIKVYLLADSSVYPTGKYGQSYVFGNQKKMKYYQIKDQDKYIENFCNLLYLKKKHYHKKYLGAGGAIGVAINAIFKTKIFNGSEFFFKALMLNKKITKKVDILISTEGKFDKTSFYGKGFEYIKNYCLKYKIRFYFIVGKATINYRHPLVKIINLRNRVLNKVLFRKKFLKNVDNLISKYDQKAH